MRQKFAKHPIYHDLHYSVRSSRHASTTSWPPRVQMNTSAPTGRPKHKRIESGWKDLDAPATPTKDLDRANRSTFFFEASPVLKPRTPEKAHVSVRPLSQLSHSSSITKLPSVAETHILTDHAMSPLDSPPLMDNGDTRWSWTNSQAPSTPRVRPASKRFSYASKYSAPRFRSVVSWARGQGERIQIDEEAPPLLPPIPPTTAPAAAPPPILQAVPANKRAFKDAVPPNLSGKKPKKSVKGHQKAASSLDALGAFFKSASNSKSTSNLPSTVTGSKNPASISKSTSDLGVLESGQAVADIELKER